MGEEGEVGEGGGGVGGGGRKREGERERERERVRRRWGRRGGGWWREGGDTAGAYQSQLRLALLGVPLRLLHKIAGPLQMVAAFRRKVLLFLAPRTRIWAALRSPAFPADTGGGAAVRVESWRVCLFVGVYLQGCACACTCACVSECMLSIVCLVCVCVCLCVYARACVCFVCVRLCVLCVCVCARVSVPSPCVFLGVYVCARV